jgi:hypothetical protein
MVLIYTTHFASPPPGYHATGFLQYDQFYYLANAREHFDGGEFNLTYGLPFSADPETPRVYVQPHSLALGAILGLTGLDPGVLYAALGLLLAVLFMRSVIALYQQFVGLDSWAEWLGLFCFAWGGGVLVLAAIFLGLLQGQDLGDPGVLFQFDPTGGFWFLNLGRNSYYTTECFYHVLFLSAIVLATRRRWGSTLGVLAVLAMSHPFSGIEALGVHLVWGFGERLLGRTRMGAQLQLDHRSGPPAGYLAGLVLLTAAHVAYYMVYLATSPDHRLLLEQWTTGTADWVLPGTSMLLAYGPVALLLSVRLRHEGVRQVLSSPSSRLLAAWALVALGLANHELLLAPHQPLHFTRGYIWTPLFLLGAPSLVRLFRAVIEIAPRPAAIGLTTGLLAIASCDNLVWFNLAPRTTGSPAHSIGFYLSDEEREVLSLMNDAAHRESLVISSDHMLGYLSTVYTPLRSWASHGYNTPNYPARVAELQAFFERGVEPPGWRARQLFIVAHAQYEPQWKANLQRSGSQFVMRNESFVVYVRAPLADARGE